MFYRAVHAAEGNKAGMRIVVSRVEGRVPVTLLRVVGEIGVESAGLLRQEAQSAVESGARHVLLDLADVTFVSSAGLRAVHYVFTLLRAASPGQGDEAVHRGIASGTYHSPLLKLLKPSQHVREALRLAGFDMFLEVHTDLQAAISSF